MFVTVNCAPRMAGGLVESIQVTDRDRRYPALSLDRHRCLAVAVVSPRPHREERLRLSGASSGPGAKDEEKREEMIFW